MQKKFFSVVVVASKAKKNCVWWSRRTNFPLPRRNAGQNNVHLQAMPRLSRRTLSKLPRRSWHTQKSRLQKIMIKIAKKYNRPVNTSLLPETSVLCASKLALRSTRASASSVDSRLTGPDCVGLNKLVWVVWPDVGSPCESGQRWQKKTVCEHWKEQFLASTSLQATRRFEMAENGHLVKKKGSEFWLFFGSVFLLPHPIPRSWNVCVTYAPKLSAIWVMLFNGAPTAPQSTTQYPTLPPTLPHTTPQHILGNL